MLARFAAQVPKHNRFSDSPCHRWPTLEDCRLAIKEEQQRLCDYIETIRFKLHSELADKLQSVGPIELPEEDLLSEQ